MGYLTTRCWKPLEDTLKGHPSLANIGSRLLSGMASLTGDRVKRLELLVRAARGCYNPARRSRLEEQIRVEAEAIDPATVDMTKLRDGVAGRTELPKGLILKPPVSPSEKGVLYVTFEQQFLRMLATGQASAIAERYDLLLGPTWSPPHDVPLLMAARSWPRPVYTILNNLNDSPAMARISRNLIPIPLLMSNWVDPAVYEPHLNRPREYDIVMVANFSTYKRHWLFFKMLRDMPKDTRVLLVGVPLGNRTEKVLRDEARAFGVEDRFELRMRLTDDAVAEALCSAKVGAIFSRQEGSCLAVVEMMFANTPVAVFRDAIVGSKAYVNPRTGLLLEPTNIAAQMQRFIDNADKYTPRSWACEHISCHRSYDVLNGFLRTDAEQNGRPWTRDLEPFYQNAVPRYLAESSLLRMRPWYEDFARSYGLTVADPSWSGNVSSSLNPQPLLRAGA